MKNLNSVSISGFDALPLIEGGKGVAVTNGHSAGAWAAAGAVGTFSGVNADSYDSNGNIIPQIYSGRTRIERHEELVDFAIKGAIEQAQIAYEKASGHGPVHMNVLWEMAAAERILNNVLEGARGLINGITCGAGMPYKVAEIASQFDVYYYPIVSSARAFRALWKRAYHKFSDWLGGVVYEDPWRAGGHNGLSNSEDPDKPEDPFPRVFELRQRMREFGLENVPIIMAGGVWFLREWQDWIDNSELGQIVFQFGTRPLLTLESPISDSWKQKLLRLSSGDVKLNKFSPTGMWSSAVNNSFIQNLIERSERQVGYSTEKNEKKDLELSLGARKKSIFISSGDNQKILDWKNQGYDKIFKTPDNSVLFVTEKEMKQIREDQVNCMGCLSHCSFSNWSQEKPFTTGKKPDPRSFCIQKTLQSVIHTNETENDLMFAGHSAYRFSEDPYYSNGFIPSVKQLVDRIVTGD
ncbi:MAG: nitronate monooxygenase [Rhodospirillaceae bacterium]|nr:nitronate monooxygenase [Rhodospirillaceae bacterium]